MKSRLSDRSGSVYIYGCFIILGIMVVLSAFVEYFRIYTTALKIESAYEKAMLSVAIENYNEIFISMREGGQVGGGFDGGNEGIMGSAEKPVWVEMNDYGNISAELSGILGAQEKNEVLQYYDKQRTLLYTVYDMSIAVRQSEGYNQGLRYELYGDFKLKLPVYFLGSEIFTLDLHIPSKASWKSRI